MPASPITTLSLPNSSISRALSPTLRGAAKYVVVLHPADGQAFCLGFQHICDSAGAQLLLQRIVEKRTRRYRKPVQGVLCDSALLHVACPVGVGCPNIHCTPAGLMAMRPWATTRPPKAPKASAEVDSSHDSNDEAGVLSPGDFSDTTSDWTSRSPGLARRSSSPRTPTSPLSPAPYPTPLLLTALKQSSDRLRQWMQHLDDPPPADAPPPLPASPLVHEPYSGSRFE